MCLELPLLTCNNGTEKGRNDSLIKQGKILILLTTIICCTVWCVSCISVSAEISGTPTPSSSPTPYGEFFSITVTGEPLPVDATGKIIDSEDHYHHYLSFGNMRIYEYNNGTFMDGICINAYPLPLDGEIYIVYYDSEGRVCGKGSILNNADGTVFKPGSNIIHSDINTDISVVDMSFSLEISRQYAPVTGES